jgi:DNA-binding beta-propeller fold protein YncE
LPTGHVFIAHTALGTVEVIDGPRMMHVRTIRGCPEASGVLCAQEDALVVAAARGAGKVLVIDAATGEVRGSVQVGPKPNGLAWDPRRKCVLVADVQDHDARLVDPVLCRVVTATRLPGRPRWCVYDQGEDRFLVNIRSPACVAVLSAESVDEQAPWPVAAAGPHGLDLDPERGLVFVACDEGIVCAVDHLTGRELGRAEIAGEPDAIWYNPDRRRLYVAIGRPGVVDVIDTHTLRHIEQIATEDGAHTTAFDRARQRLYVFLPRSCRAAVYQET